MTDSKPTEESRTRQVVAVLGCYRGGTSLLARLLPVIGVPLEGELMRAGGCNPTGFWENQDILQVNEELAAYLPRRGFSPNLEMARVQAQPGYPLVRERALEILKRLFEVSPVVGFKHPATSRLLPFWQGVFEEVQAGAAYLIAVRDPGATAESLRVNFHLRIEAGLLLWLEHLMRALQFTQARPRVIVSYERMLEAPPEQIARIVEAFGKTQQIDNTTIDWYAQRFVDRRLQHAAGGSRQTRRLLTDFPLVGELDGLLRARADDAIDELGFMDAAQSLIARFDRELPAIRLRYPCLADAERSRISRAGVLYFRLRHEGVRSTLRRLQERLEARLVRVGDRRRNY
ncbi:sulfotransferase family protein [Thiohalocapsa halophila]|uniref:sulfotransferase family protein n=1 Tax=Thiohalocapsa halophila TaxID=69359 RepID=UPI001903855F|nr:hypothetical protein [Thiohalocapsa halophila]